jgi:hypothetical protein
MSERDDELRQEAVRQAKEDILYFRERGIKISLAHTPDGLEHLRAYGEQFGEPTPLEIVRQSVEGAERTRRMKRLSDREKTAEGRSVIREALDQVGHDDPLGD